MGPFVSPRWVQVLAWLVTAIIVALNTKLVYEGIRDWMDAAGPYRWLVAACVIPIALGLAGLLVWMTLRRDRVVGTPSAVSPDEVVAAASRLQKRFHRIGVALDASSTDAGMLAEAIALARIHGAELVLMHVVEGAGSQWHGPQTGDLESRHDETYLAGLIERLAPELAAQGVPRVEGVLGYGDVPKEIVRLARTAHVDLLVLGGHGHRGLGDLLHGQTIPSVRHALGVPILAVPPQPSGPGPRRTRGGQPPRQGLDSSVGQYQARVLMQPTTRWGDA
jgi:manganese transport protein